MADVNDGGVAGKSHGGPGHDDREGFMPLNRPAVPAYDKVADHCEDEDENSGTDGY